MSYSTIAKGVAAAVTGAATPWVTYLTSAQDLNTRFLVLTAIISLVGFVNAGAAFLSTSVATDKVAGK